MTTFGSLFSGIGGLDLGLERAGWECAWTPTASDHIERESTSSEALNFDTNKTVTLDRWVGRWPTPKGSAANYGRPRPNDRGDLQAAVMLPTPSASSYGTNQGGSAGRVGPVRPSLETMARKDLWPTPKSSPSGPDYARADREESGGDDLATAVARSTPGQLNPTWVEWLMGFPLGWTDLEGSETPSSPSSPSGSDAD